MNRRLQLALTVLGILTSSLSAHAQDALRANAGGRMRTVPRQALTDDDRARLEGGRGADVSSSIRESMEAGLPRSASVRARMSPVRDQGGRGTCSVFAAVALFEAATRLDLSEQCLAFQASDRDEGQVSQRLGHAFGRGLYTEDECPYSEDRNQIPALGRPSIASSGSGTMLEATSLSSLAALKRLIVSGQVLCRFE